MTIPPRARSTFRRVTDVVRDMMPFIRHTLGKDEQAVSIYLRNNEPLYQALRRILLSRIEGRAQRPVPSNPQDCQASMVRDAEVRWLISRIDLMYRSPAEQQADSDSEQPTAQAGR